jgi:hypothetical protein
VQPLAFVLLPGRAVRSVVMIAGLSTSTCRRSYWFVFKLVVVVHLGRRAAAVRPRFAVVVFVLLSSGRWVAREASQSVQACNQHARRSPVPPPPPAQQDLESAAPLLPPAGHCDQAHGSNGTESCMSHILHGGVCVCESVRVVVCKSSAGDSTLRCASSPSPYTSRRPKCARVPFELGARRPCGRWQPRTSACRSGRTTRGGCAPSPSRLGKSVSSSSIDYLRFFSRGAGQTAHTHVSAAQSPANLTAQSHCCFAPAELVSPVQLCCFGCPQLIHCVFAGGTVDGGLPFAFTLIGLRAGTCGQRGGAPNCTGSTSSSPRSTGANARTRCALLVLLHAVPYMAVIARGGVFAAE